MKWTNKQNAKRPIDREQADSIGGAGRLGVDTAGARDVEGGRRG